MENRECRKCGEQIPKSIKIDGKSKSLKNRKFCLKCSKYGNKNTSAIDPIERRMPKRYCDRTNEQKKTAVLSLYKRGLERKRYFVNKSGGKCIKCGYNKCSRALEFHHIDPSNKKFSLGLNNLWSKTIDELEKEWEKCQLLCSNCHTEAEEEMARTGFDYVSAVNKKYGTNF